MQHLDPLEARPRLVSPTLLARALDALRPEGRTTSELWRLLTDRYVVDLDAAATLLPADESRTLWLTARG